MNLNQTVNQSVPQLVSGATSKNGAFIILPKEVLSGLPKMKRKPYLHFILDFFKGIQATSNTYVEQINSVMNQYSDVNKIKITAANFDVEELTPKLISSQDKYAIRHAMDQSRLGNQGSLDLGRVIKQELARYYRNLNGENWQEYPLFIVMTQNPMNILPPDDMEFFSLHLPDCNYYLFSAQLNQIEKRPLWMSSQGMKEREVFVLKSNDLISILPASSEDAQAAYFYGHDGSSGAAIYDSSLQSFLPVKGAWNISEASSYAQGVDLIFKNFQVMTNPREFDKSLPALVQASRDSGIMIPSTSYIIVERSSQWKTLRLKEKQRLGISQGLEFEEDFNTPSPPLWLMLFLLFIFYWVKNRKGSAMPGEERKSCVLRN